MSSFPPIQVQPTGRANAPGSSRPAALFVLSAAWMVFSLSMGRELSHMAPAIWEDLLRVLLSAAFLAGGYYFLARAWVRDLRPLSVIGFVRRPGIATEFGRGAALGWAIGIAFVLPAMLTGNLSLTFGADVVALSRTLLSIAVLCAYALLAQLFFAGLPVRMLQRAVGDAWTIVAVVFLAVFAVVLGPQGQGGSILFAALAASLFTAGFLRTRALWLTLGVQIGWTVSLQLIFGANSPYTPVTYGIVQSDTGGPAWLTGGPFGPEASLFAILVLIAALVVLVRITRDYAWHYTFEPITGAGYAVEVPPPAAHTREEQRMHSDLPGQRISAPLVQIGGLTGTSTAPNPPVTPPDPLP